MSFVGLYARKIGMTSMFNESGERVSVTALQADPCIVIDYKTLEKHGYSAIVVGYGRVKEQKINKPMMGYFKKLNCNFFANVKEFRVDNPLDFALGQEIGVSFLDENVVVDAKGISTGKGFAGAMKRHNFGGLRASHGVSAVHRSHGSTGSCQDPGRVWKNKKMAGHLGVDRVTIQNLSVVRVNRETGLILVKGAVPGKAGSMVSLLPAIKRRRLNAN